jgi:hypothetical protein
MCIESSIGRDGLEKENMTIQNVKLILRSSFVFIGNSDVLIISVTYSVTYIMFCFTTRLHLVPRSKNEWSYTSTPPIHLHGVVLS